MIYVGAVELWFVAALILGSSSAMTIRRTKIVMRCIGSFVAVMALLDTLMVLFL